MGRGIPRIVDPDELEKLKEQIQGVMQDVRNQADAMLESGMIEPMAFLGDTDFDGLHQAGFVGKDNTSYYVIYRDKKVRLQRK